ncbi:MAG: PAS domain-containing protein [Gammaproteobacteria bacterium]|jgi:PAS domain S-box-containing protein
MDHRIESEALADLSNFPGVGFYEWHVAEDRLVWSPELISIYGLSEAPNAECGFTDLVHPEDRTRVEAETATFMGGGTNYEHEFRIVRPDGEIRTIHDRGRIERADDGTPLVLRGMNVDITDQLEARGSPSAVSFENEQRLQLVCEAANMGIWDADLRDNRSVWSAELYDLLGLEQVLPASPELFFKYVHPDDIDDLRVRFAEAIDRRETFSKEFRVVRRDGAVRFVRGVGRVVEEIDGVAARMIGVNYDITERRDTEARSRLMMQEAYHRSKNILSMVQAIIRQSVRHSPDDFVSSVEGRIRALSASHDLLFSNDWEGVAIEDLARSQLAPFSQVIDKRIILRGENFQISAAAAQLLGMALYELATNAGKYGALSNEDGRIEIHWDSKRGADGERRFSIAWSESGGPPVAKPKRQGFGSTVTGRVVESSLNARVDTDYALEGLTWRFECPAHDILETGC